MKRVEHLTIKRISEILLDCTRSYVLTTSYRLGTLVSELSKKDAYEISKCLICRISDLIINSDVTYFTKIGIFTKKLRKFRNPRDGSSVTKKIFKFKPSRKLKTKI